MKILYGKKFYAIGFAMLFMLMLSCQMAQAGALSVKHLNDELQAKSAILMDENGIVLFEKNSHQPLPPASVTKTITLLLAVEAVEMGKVQLNDLVMTSENAWRQGGSQIWLEKSETMTFHEMLIALAMVSANDAAVALMEHIYGSEPAAVAAMNERIQEMGLMNTHFANVNGLPAENHYMSTHDTALIVREALRHPLYMEICGLKEYWLRSGKNWLVNTNKLLWWYKGADGLKTGWTDAAKYCFAGTAKRDDLRLISVVFAAPEPRSHFKESMKLLDWGFANFKAYPAVRQDEVIAQLSVRNGKADTVQLSAAQNLNVLIAKGEDQGIEREVMLDNNVTAPIIAGEKYGELLILKAGKECAKVDLIAVQNVEKAGLFRTLQAMMLKFFSN